MFCQLREEFRSKSEQIKKYKKKQIPKMDDERA